MVHVNQCDIEAYNHRPSPWSRSPPGQYPGDAVDMLFHKSRIGNWEYCASDLYVDCCTLLITSFSVINMNSHI